MISQETTTSELNQFPEKSFRDWNQHLFPNIIHLVIKNIITKKALKGFTYALFFIGLPLQHCRLAVITVTNKFQDIKERCSSHTPNF